MLIFQLNPLNRFECYFLNTAEDTCQYIELVDREQLWNVYMILSIANIEEKDPSWRQ